MRSVSPVKSVTIKHVHSYIAQINEKGCLFINSVLTLASLPTLAYILAHEICHILEETLDKGHGKEFYKAFNKVRENLSLPDFYYVEAEIASLSDRRSRMNLPIKFWTKSLCETNTNITRDKLKDLFMDFKYIYWCEKCERIQRRSLKPVKVVICHKCGEPTEMIKNT